MFDIHSVICISRARCWFPMQVFSLISFDSWWCVDAVPCLMYCVCVLVFIDRLCKHSYDQVRGLCGKLLFRRGAWKPIWAWLGPYRVWMGPDRFSVCQYGNVRVSCGIMFPKRHILVNKKKERTRGSFQEGHVFPDSHCSSCSISLAFLLSWCAWLHIHSSIARKRSGGSHGLSMEKQRKKAEGEYKSGAGPCSGAGDFALFILNLPIKKKKIIQKRKGWGTWFKSLRVPLCKSKW